jgi:DNA-binding NarL/FixJ family response regulator
VIVDDHPIVRQGLQMLMEGEPDLELCGESDNTVDALTMIEKVKPDLAIVDLALRDSSGLDLIKDLQVRLPDLPVLVLSMREEGFYAERVLRAGARGYVAKEEGPKQLLEGVRRVLQGQVYVSDRIASKVMSKIVSGADQTESPIGMLSDRELEVFELIGQGLPTREIAKRLHISSKTVDSHREHIKRKLGLDSGTDLLKHAIEWKQSGQ